MAPVLTVRSNYQLGAEAVVEAGRSEGRTRTAGRGVGFRVVGRGS